MTEVLIPARQGRAARVPRGAAIEVINTHGNQVVDFWALRDLGIAPPACPQDLTPVNGAAQRPVDAHFRIRLGAEDDG